MAAMLTAAEEPIPRFSGIAESFEERMQASWIFKYSERSINCHGQGILQKDAMVSLLEPPGQVTSTSKRGKEMAGCYKPLYALH